MSLTLTIRLIKSFEYRTFKNVVLHELSPQTTIAQLKEMVRKRNKTSISNPTQISMRTLDTNHT